MFQVILGMVEDEANDLFFNQEAVRDGIGPQTRDQYLRTLIRNTYNYHMNEIFATVQNEYTDWSLQVSLVEILGCGLPLKELVHISRKDCSERIGTLIRNT